VRAASKHRVTEGQPRQFLFSPTSVTFVASLVSVVICNFAAYSCNGRVGVLRCWTPRVVLRMAPTAMLFTVSNLMKFVAMFYLPVDMLTLLEQLSLVILALMTERCLNRRHSPPQWCSLVIVSVSMVQYMSLRDGDRHQRFINSPTEMSANLWMGIGLMVPQVFISVFASVLCELQLKDEKELSSFWEQRAAWEVSGSAIALVVVGFDTKVREHGLFVGWDAMTYLVLGMLLAKSLLAGIITKKLDSIVKQLGSCSAMLMIYFEMLLLPEPWGQRDMSFDFNAFVALVIVALSIASFAASSQYTQTVERNEARIRCIMELAGCNIAV